MEKFITATGKTIDLAIEAGLTQLSMDRDSVSVEILETPKSGFFGIGASPAKVKLTYEAPDEPAAPAPALSSASRSKPKKSVSEKPAEAANAPKVIAPAAAPMQRPAEQRASAKPTAEKPERTEKPRQEKPRQPKENKPRQEKPRQPKPQQPKKEAAPAEPKVYTPAEPGSTEERIEQFIKGLLEHMGSDAVPHAMKTADESYSVDLVGENLGILIGRRGETLDAIQHLTNYAVNRGSDKHMHISVDAESYRAKREESLVRLAEKMAAKAIKYKRSMALEPMNSYERHVIHTALQDYEGVTTSSTGTEPNRRVVVSYEKPQRTSNKPVSREWS